MRFWRSINVSKKRWTVAATVPPASLAVAGLLGILASPAAAQIQNPLPLRVKLGVFLPQSGNTKSDTGDVHFNAEVDLALPLPGAGSKQVSVGYMQSVESGTKLRTIPVTVTQVFSPPNPASGVTGNVYFGVGAGVYFLRASGGGVSESKTRLGGFGMAGYQFPNAFFVEAKYHLVSGKVADLSPNGIAFLMGRRF